MPYFSGFPPNIYQIFYLHMLPTIHCYALQANITGWAFLSCLLYHDVLKTFIVKCSQSKGIDRFKR